MERSYRELVQLKTIEERFGYLQLNGLVAKETFGFDRYLNQVFYRTPEWKRLRRDIIIRDQNCDLGILDREIFGTVVIHHINPIAVVDILERSDLLLLPEFLITTSLATHNAIHYGDANLLISDPITRRPNDTSPWK